MSGIYDSEPDYTAEKDRQIAALTARAEAAEALLLRIHDKALPANWEYVDPLTTADLVIAEMNCLRKEKEAAEAREKRLREALEESPEHAYFCDANDYLTEEAQARECHCTWADTRKAALKEGTDANPE